MAHTWRCIRHVSDGATSASRRSRATNLKVSRSRSTPDTTLGSLSALREGCAIAIPPATPGVEVVSRTGDEDASWQTLGGEGGNLALSLVLSDPPQSSPPWLEIARGDQRRQEVAKWQVPATVPRRGSGPCPGHLQTLAAISDLNSVGPQWVGRDADSWYHWPDCQGQQPPRESSPGKVLRGAWR